MVNDTSSWRTQRNGLPQGSVLASVPLNLYSNNLPVTRGLMTYVLPLKDNTSANWNAVSCQIWCGCHTSVDSTGGPVHLSDSLQPTTEIIACRCLHSADTTTLQVPSTRRATLGDCAFPVAAARAWNSLLYIMIRDSSQLLLTFDIPKRDQVTHFSSYG